MNKLAYKHITHSVWHIQTVVWDITDGCVAKANDDTQLHVAHTRVYQPTVCGLWMLTRVLWLYLPSRKKFSRRSHVKDLMASKLHGQPVSPSEYFKRGGLEEQGEKSRIFTLHGLLGEHRYQHTVPLLAQLSTSDTHRHSLVRDEHLNPQRGRLRCQRVLSISFCFSISVTVSLSLSSFMCFQAADIDGLFFPTKCWVFERLSLSICYLIFQCEVFPGVVLTGSATGIGALVTYVKNNLCARGWCKKVWMKKKVCDDCWDCWFFCQYILYLFKLYLFKTISDL